MNTNQPLISFSSIRFVLTLFTVSIISTLGLSSAYAAIIVVDSNTVEEINGDGTCSLIEAINSALNNVSVDICVAGDDNISGSRGSSSVRGTGTPGSNPLPSAGDIIQLPEGVIFDVTIPFLGPNGLPRIINNIIINGNNSTIRRPSATSNRRTATAQFRLLEITNGAGDIRLNDLTLSGGDVNGNGGAILNQGSALTLNNVRLENNIASSAGGGLHQSTFATTLNINNSQIENNIAGTNGGGIYNNGATARITDSTIRNNQATGNFMGGGGGIYNTSSGVTLLTSSTVSGNSITGTGTTNSRGGGIYNNDGGNITAINSTISSNTALRGGGIFNDSLLTPTVILDNSTVANNDSSGTGAAGSGLDNTGAVTLNYSIIGGNIGTAATQCINNSIGTVTNNNSLIESGNANCNLIPALAIAPLLGPLGNNGGATQTHALMPNSPAFNPVTTPDDGACAQFQGVGLTLDQRGEMRDNDCDLGAFENTAPTIPNPLADLNVVVGAPNEIIDLSTVFSDTGDLTMALTYTVSNNTNAPLFNSVDLPGSSNTLTLDYGDTPGSAVISVEATGFGGLTTEEMFTVAINAAPPPITPDITADMFMAIPPSAFQTITPEQLDMLPPDVIRVLTPEQFNNIPSNVLSVLDAGQVDVLNMMVLQAFMRDDVDALADDIFAQSPSQITSRFLVNVDPDMVSPVDVMPLLPPGWSIDIMTGELTAPAGEPIMLPAMPAPSTLPMNLAIPAEIPDLSRTFGLGGQGGTTLIDSLNQALVDAGVGGLMFSQDAVGALSVSGNIGNDPLALAFIVDVSQLAQSMGDAMEPPGITLTTEETGTITTTLGQFVITIDGKRIPLIPAPQDPLLLAEAFSTSDTVFIGDSGEVIIRDEGQEPQVFLFNSAVIDAPAGMSPGLNLFPDNPRGPGRPVGLVVYNNGRAQQVSAYIPNPPAFVQAVMNFPGAGIMGARANLQTGVITAFLPDNVQVLLVPQSTRRLRILGATEIVPASLTLNPNLTLDYAIGEGGEELLTLIVLSF